MAKRVTKRVWVKVLTADEKAAIGARGERLISEEFDAGYARLDHVEESIQELRFDVMWHRHTGQWWRLHAALTLDEALAEVERMIPPV